jgi:hypothetical protein
MKIPDGGFEGWRISPSLIPSRERMPASEQQPEDQNSEAKGIMIGGANDTLIAG